MRKALLTFTVCLLLLVHSSFAQSWTTYKGMHVRTPDPTGDGGLNWQNNFKALADRIGNHIEATDDPGPTDDGVGTGGEDAVMYLSTWRNTNDNGLWFCLDPATNAAQWVELTGGSGASHDAVTLNAAADTVLQLSGQELRLDTQVMNRIFAGPASGADATPIFRALVANDIPDLSSVYQAADADLTTWAGVTSSANGRSLVSAENYAAMKTLLAYGTMADQAADSVAITGGTGTFATLRGKAPIADVVAYGAIGDGITDDTASIQAALNACSNVYIPAGTYICAALTVNANQRVFGDGPSSILSLKEGETGYLIECGTNSCQVSDIVLSGGLTSTQAASESQGNRSGIHISTISAYSSLRNVVCRGFSDAGIVLNGNSTTRNCTPTIVGCSSYWNYIGIDTGRNNITDTGGEYIKVGCCTFRANRYGIKVNSGNTAFSACAINDNGYGVHVTDAYNGGHGSITGSTINHNTILGILVEDNPNGFSFSGCQGWYCNVTVTNSSGVVLTGCNFGGATTITLTGGGPGILANNWFASTPTLTRSSDKFLVASNPCGRGSLVYVEDSAFWVIDDATQKATCKTFGIGTTLPLLPLHAEGRAAAPATSGSTFTGIGLLAGTSGHTNGLNFGVYNTTPYGFWMRATDRTNMAITYPMVLQPSGGSVGINETTPDYKLDVNGTFGSTPGTNSVPIDNGDVTLDFPTATTIRIRGKNGGTVRNLTLPISDSTALIASDQNAGTDITADLEEETHASEHAVGGGDTVFPADPNADKLLKWDDDPGALVWADDTDTTYSAGDGLDLTGTTFSTDLKSGGGLEIDSGELTLTSTHLTGEIGITIDGAGSEIADGVKGFVRVPYACTITGVYLMADQTGSIVVDVWKDTFANYPPTVADTITASAKPTLSSAISESDTTLTDWTKDVSAGDVIGFKVDSCDTITRLTLQIVTTK